MMDVIPKVIPIPSSSSAETFESQFYSEIRLQQRRLEEEEDNNNNKNKKNWNMCSRLIKYAIVCDENCQAISNFNNNEWSDSDRDLLVMLILANVVMMVIIFHRRIKMSHSFKSEFFDRHNPRTSLSVLLLVFVGIFVVIGVLAALRFVNETLVFSIVSCFCLFGYMLKLTLKYSEPKPKAAFSEPLQRWA